MKNNFILKNWLFFNREILLPILAIAAIVVVGTIGYHLIEGWSYFDSLYMTIITLSTVGFGELKELSQEGRIFTIFLIIVGVGVVTVLVTSFASKLIEKQFDWIVGRRKMRNRLKKVSGHTVVCGYGRLSQIACEDLKTHCELVIIEQDERLVEIAQSEGFLIIRGDATAEDVLLDAGVSRAAKLVSLLPKDSDNLYAVLTSRELNSDLYILTRAEDAQGEVRLRRAGADRIIAPYRAAGRKVSDALMRPHVADFLELAASGADLQIEEIKISADSPLSGCSLQESNLRQKTNIIIVAIISSGGETIFNPSGSTIIEPDSMLIGLGQRGDFIEFEKLVVRS